MNKNKKYLFILLISFLLFLNVAPALAAIEVPLLGLPENPTLPDYMKSFLQLLVGAGGVLAALVVVIGGIRYMSAAGNPESVSKGVDLIKGGILGLVLLLSSWLIIKSINPSLTTIELKKLVQLPGLVFVGGKETAPVPNVITSIAKIKEKYSGIQWPKTLTDENGNTVTNCEDDDLPYFIYAFPKEGLEWPAKNHYIPMDELYCGKTLNLKDALGKSFYIVRATLGIYFYDNDLCLPDATTGIPYSHTVNINNVLRTIFLETGGYIKSFRVVSAAEGSQGPFYGAIFWHYPNYSGSYIHYEAQMKVAEGNIPGGHCYKIPDAGSSITIYQQFGRAIDNSSGEGVELRTDPNYSGGVLLITDKDIVNRRIYISQLKGLTPNFSGTNIPIERQKLCKAFDSRECLQSIKIYGDYLVLLSQGAPDLAKFQNGKKFPDPEKFIGEQFPSPVASTEEMNKYKQYSASDGPIDLNLDWIYHAVIEAPTHIMIIPLSEPLSQ